VVALHDGPFISIDESALLHYWTGLLIILGIRSGGKLASESYMLGPFGCMNLEQMDFI
jgi:hypothetical protein